MAETAKFLAIDLGAESGRGVVGLLGDDGKLSLEEVHRFPTGPVRVLDHLHWDVLRFFTEIKAAVRQCAQTHGADLRAIGVDTWGSILALGRGDCCLATPITTATSAPDGMMEEAFRRVPAKSVRADRHPVHEAEHPLSACHARGVIRRCWRWRDAAPNAGPVQLLPHRHQGRRVQHRHHHPVLRSPPVRLGHPDPRSDGSAHRHPARDHSAGHARRHLLASVAGETGAGRVPVVAPPATTPDPPLPPCRPAARTGATSPRAPGR